MVFKHPFFITVIFIISIESICSLLAIGYLNGAISPFTQNTRKADQIASPPTISQLSHTAGQDAHYWINIICSCGCSSHRKSSASPPDNRGREEDEAGREENEKEKIYPTVWDKLSALSRVTEESTLWTSGWPCCFFDLQAAGLHVDWGRQ